MRLTVTLLTVLMPASLTAGAGSASSPSGKAAGPLVLARDGRTEYVVVQADHASEPERFAAGELTHFLSRVTGVAFPVVSESALAAGARGIYVGWTKFAGRQGINPVSLGEEEWIIRTVGQDLVLTGGRPRGTMYAVYEFLERPVGCHWLDRETEIVPSRPTLAVDALDVKAKPWFWIRHVSSPTGSPADHWLFLVRNKNYRYDQPENFAKLKGDFPRGAFSMLRGTPRVGHSFSYLVNAKDWYRTHPEYFSLDADGKRVPAYDEAGPGQLCLTNPDVRRLAVEKLRGFVAKDRAEAAAKGCPPPKIYMIGQNDKYDAHCKCANCQAIARREGSESGPLVDFVNAIGEAIEGAYPDILLETYAYNLTQPPPKTIRPRRNVQIGWCDVYSKCDVLRPLSHPFNRTHYEQIKAWGKIAPHVGIGDDYWTLFGYYETFPLPWTMVQCVVPDLKHFADCGAETFFAESADYMEPGENFIALKFWLAYQLLVNPHQPAEPLIRTFLDGYYGAAAPATRRWLAYLTERIDRDAQFMMARSAADKLAYLDLPFFRTSQQLFDEAESQVAPGSLAAGHVQRERFKVDGALLFLWPWLDRKLPLGTAMPLDKETAIRRYDAAWRAHRWYHRWYTEDKDKRWQNPDGKLRQRMVALFRDARLPEPFCGRPLREVADFNWLTFSPITPRQKFVIDPDAAGDMAAEPTGLSAILAAEEGASTGAAAEPRLSRTVKLGVTGGPTVTLTPDQIPQDGTYHLYRIGPVKIKEGTGRDAPTGTTVWALEGRKLGVCVDRLYVPDATEPDANVWDAYISLKLSGPAYVKGSTAPNAVRMDRVLLVKPRPGQAADATEPRRQEKQRAGDSR